MNKRKNILLAEIETLLKGPQPDRTLFYLGKYLLFENDIMKEITEIEAKAMLNETPSCKIFFIRIGQEQVPDFIQSRVNPPHDQIIEAADIATGKEFIRLITGRKEF